MCRTVPLGTCGSAGHASTLGTQIDLAAELRAAFGNELGLPPADEGPPLEPVRSPRGLAMCGDEAFPFAWANGLVARPFEPLPVDEYGEWNRGGKRCPL